MMTREQIAELVGCYFGLQRAGNMRVSVGPDLAEGAGVAINKLRAMIDVEMDAIVRKLPPGVVETWPAAPRHDPGASG